MDQDPLVMEQIDAGARFLREFGESIPVRAAFWLKAGEGGQWYLYVASEQVDEGDLGVTYGEVLRAARTMPDPNFDPFRVKLIGADNPLARAASDILRLYTGRMATRLRGRVFGGIFVDEVYIYPATAPVPTP